jgi:GT2 family glycosyltransferase
MSGLLSVGTGETGARHAPHVAVIVLTWNQCNVTLDCLRSLHEQDYPGVQIILVDNGSTDGTPEAIRAAYPELNIIENGQNLGFAEGNNVGLRRALGGNADYIFLLNNDTAVDRAMIGTLVETLEADRTLGITGPKMLYYDRPDTIWCAGNRIDWQTGESIRLRADEPDDADETQRDVDFITACAICLRREVIEQIGLLDPRFFIYYEETDWCTRARHLGWRIRYVPRARLWHKVSATMGTTSPATEYYMTRNVMLFIWKNRQAYTRFTGLLTVIARNMRTMAAYSVKPRFRERRRNRDARLLALRDAALGRWGKMGADVSTVCYGKAT